MMTNQLLLNKNIYDNESIRKAAAAYRSLCRIMVSEQDSYRILRFEDCRTDCGRTMNEFGNYVLAEVIKKRRIGQ